MTHWKATPGQITLARVLLGLSGVCLIAWSVREVVTIERRRGVASRRAAPAPERSLERVVEGVPEVFHDPSWRFPLRHDPVRRVVDWGAEREAEVEGLLEALGAEQGPRGFWGEEEGAVERTGWVLLAFLGHGHTHRFGAHRRVVNRGLQWLKRQQQASGAFDPSPRAHVVATWALCEAYAVSRDFTLKRYAEKGLVWLHDLDGIGWHLRAPALGGVSRAWVARVVALGAELDLEVGATFCPWADATPYTGRGARGSHAARALRALELQAPYRDRAPATSQVEISATTRELGEAEPGRSTQGQ